MYALLIAEDADEAAIFSLVLQRAGLAVTTAKDLEQGLQRWPERPADIILLAISQPSPVDQVRRVRSETLVPLILAIETVNERSHYEMLKLGADLVVPSPFSVKLLIAQVGVLMRRSGNVPTSSLPTLDASGLILDPSNRTIVVADKPARRLTHLEFRLLYTLMMNRNQVISTDAIVEAVWGYTGQGDRDLVRGLINRLRAKVEIDRRNPRYILTVPGVGYRFSDDIP